MTDGEAHVLQFDGFELDVLSGELWAAGRRISLQPQPLKLLALLATRLRSTPHSRGDSA